MQRRYALAFIIWLLIALPHGNALCIYKGKLYAKTTVSEEFRDSKWVVKVRVLSSDDHWLNNDPSWTIYYLSVLQSFKNRAPSRITMFTFHDSGGFYLDKGREYLLFLNPVTNSPDVPEQVLTSTEVNYSCGESKPWSEVSAPDMQELIRLTSLQ